MQRNYYAIIPANVRYDKNLKDKAKLLYGEITALCNEKGYCWASNRYFAELYSVSIKTISTLIKNLIDNGYIYSEIIYKEGSKEIDKRYLKLVNNPIENIVNTPMEEKVNTSMEEKVNTPMEEKVKDNNTVVNNTIINNKKEKKEKKKTKKEPTQTEIDEVVNAYTSNEELKTAIIEFVKFRKGMGKGRYMTTYAVKLLTKKLDRFANDDNTKIEIINKSILNGWSDVYELKEPCKNKGGFNNEPRSNTSKNNEPSKGESKEEHDAEYWKEQNRILDEMLDSYLQM